MGPKYPQRPHVKDLVPSPLCYYEVDATRKKKTGLCGACPKGTLGHWPFPFLSLSFCPSQNEKLSLLHVLAMRDCAAPAQIWPRGNGLKVKNPWIQISWLFRLTWHSSGNWYGYWKVIAFKGIADVCYLHCSRSIRTKKQKTQTTKK